MKDKDELVYIGKYNSRFNRILGVDLKELEIYRSKGLPAHMLKRKHYKALKYIDFLPDILENPDYIGINPNEQENSIEIIKRYKENVLVGIKLNRDGDYYYVSTIYDVQESKITRRLYGGRIKPYEGNSANDESKDSEEESNLNKPESQNIVDNEENK